ncbi:Zinc finger, RING/FYVE/PHD-type [Phytophthora cactorum]|nr:Zinc finger, RING/FYVE/PHD-type [Phytophthora cactorum]
MAQMHDDDVEWLDSELEDSPRSNDDISSMFSSSPNAKAGGGVRWPENNQQMQRPAAVSYAGSEDVEDVEGDMTSFYGQQFAPQPEASNYRLPAKSAVLVRGASGNYYVYHLEITSDYYKQKWVVCKRYSEFYRLRKRLLTRLAAHKKQRGCSVCGAVRDQLKDVGFPRRVVMFKDPSSLVGKRTAGLEEFIVALCEYLAAEQEVEVCSEITATRFLLKYVDPRDVQVDSDSCPICLCEWAELDGNELVLSPCGHFFHEHCINEWYRTRFDCPICRTISGEEENNNSNY